MRVFCVTGPEETYVSPEIPTANTLSTVVLGSNAYIVEEPGTPSYDAFRLSAQKWLIRTNESYIGGETDKTCFYSRVRIQGVTYLKVPLFFPWFCNYTASSVVDKRRSPCSSDVPRFQTQPGFTLYDYQQTVMTKLLPQLTSAPYYSGILHAPCGAGKTGMACYVIAQLGVRPVIFVNTNHLMSQWVDELKAWLGLDEINDIGYIGGQHAPPTKVYPVLICMLQSLRVGGALEAQVKQHIIHYDLLISDECHHMAADTYYETMSYFKGRHRLALSATLERSDDMVRLIPYLFGPIACAVQEDQDRSTYEKYLHPLYYTNPAHQDRLYLKQWNPNATPKLNYGRMMSRVGEDLNRIRLAVQYILQTFPAHRILFLSKLRCQAEYVTAYLQFREHVYRTWPVMKSLGLPRHLMWYIWRQSHTLVLVEQAARERTRLRLAKDNGTQPRAKRKQSPPKRVKKTRKGTLHNPPPPTKVFTYMGGDATTPAKRRHRDVMLETATYLSCTAAIAGEAFNVRNVHVLCILSVQKPNGILEQFEGRVKRGKFVDRVDVVTLLDMGNPTFAATGRAQIQWFREQRYVVGNSVKLSVDQVACPFTPFEPDKKSQMVKESTTTLSNHPNTRPRTLLEKMLGAKASN